MYKNRKYGKKRNLNTIEENASLKVQRTAEQDASNREDTTEITIEQQPGSEENIPASQEHTQRFLSQRSMVLAATLGRTQSSSRMNCSRQPNSYFELVLLKAGVLLDEGDTFVLSCDHVAIVSKLRDIFVRAQNYPDNVETFKTGLGAALAPKSKLAQKLLTGCTIDAAGEQQVYQSQNSMFVNFLMIDFLREPSLAVLLEKIEEIAASERELLTQSNIPLLPLMLTQLRFLTLSHSEQIYERIKLIFNKASESAMLDIIGSAEFLFDASKHDEFVELLIKNYARSKDLFQMVTVQTLSNLSLSVKTQDKLRARILTYIKDNQCPNMTLPHLIRFLLNSLSQDTDEVMRELISTLREIFNWRHNTQSGNDKQSQLELFSFLQQGLTRSKRFYQMWQKTIAGLPANGFKSFDLIMLLLLIHIKEDNSLYIENILRRRVKLEHITVDILDDVKKYYAHILEQYINILMQILHDFMREKQRAVSDFAKSAYSILFKICDSIQKDIIKKLMELTCDKSSQNMITIALQLLCELHRKHTKDVQNWAMLLLPLLDRLSDLTLAQTRIAMELLCRVAFPAPNLPECSTLQEQIDMMVKKQLINRTEFVKKQGIIGSVQLIDAISRIEEHGLNTNEFETSIDTINEIPDGRGKIAANLITLTETSIRNCAESLALFYDELATVFNARYHSDDPLVLDSHFLVWLCELMTYHFQTDFVAEHQPDTINGIKLDMMKCINQLNYSNVSSSESLKIGINISELVLAPNSDAHCSVFVLAPLFNFVRVLHLQRHSCSLEAINALLGCAIILPTFDEDSNFQAIFDNFDEEQQKRILHIYFHTINWLRVTICAFASQRNPDTRSHVLLRLGELIQTEQRVKLLLARAPVDFVPPPSQFLTIATAGRQQAQHNSRDKAQSSKTKAKAKPNETATDSIMLNETCHQTRLGGITIKLAACKSTKSKIDFDHLYGPMEKYRHLETDLMLLLQDLELSLSYPLEPEQIGSHLGVLELRFILTDLVRKLESVVIWQQDTDDCLMQHLANSAHFMSDLKEFLSKINKHLGMLAKAIEEQLEKVNHLHSNLDLFTEHFNYIKVCYGLCIRLFALYFSWNEWTDKSQAELLQSSMLNFFHSDMLPELRKKPNAYVAAKLFKNFVKYEKSVLTLSAAVQLQQLLRSLRKLSWVGEDAGTFSEQQTEEIRKLCGKLLGRKWYHYTGCLEKGAQCNVYLDELVKGYLKDSSYARQREILRTLLEECQLLNTKDKALDSFPNFKKANFPLFFRGLCEILICTLTAQLSADNGGDRFKLWETTVKLLNGLLEIVQLVEQPRNFVLFLKHSLLFLKLLLARGLSVLETTVRDNPDRLGLFLRHLQTVTRFLHQLCCHSKYIKNTAAISYIPLLRETIETLVFRVKALLAANKCHSVFQMGNLMNKDLHGEAIVTPVSSYASAPTETNSDEEIPADDASVDETVLGEELGDRTAASSSMHSANNRSKSSSRSKCF